MLTARDTLDDKIKGFEVGADDYLNKPFDSEVLLLKIQAIIQRKTVESVADSNQFEFEIGSFKLNSKLLNDKKPLLDPLSLSILKKMMKVT